MALGISKTTGKAANIASYPILESAQGKRSIMNQSGEIVILQGVDHYRVMEAMSEGMRIILSYRGEPYSPNYVQGISGAAFRMAGICPCAPTCSNIMEPAALARLFGYEAESWSLKGSGLPGERESGVVLARVKHEIRSGKPVLLWHAFTTAEWDVVCGFDGEKEIFYGRGSYAGTDAGVYASAAENRALTCMDICPALGAVFVGEKVGEYDAVRAERDALIEAVRHARVVKKENATDGSWVFLEGIQCYQRWAREFREDEQRKRTAGDSYCIGIYRSTRRAAAEFLRELVYKYESAAVDLRRGQQLFERETELLDRCAQFLGWETPESADAERNGKVANLLEQASEAYADGIEALETALTKM